MAVNSLRFPYHSFVIRHQGALLKRVLSGGAWATLGQLWFGVASILIHWLLARLLPPEQYGAYSLLASIASGGMIVASLGLNPTLLRTLAETRASGRMERGVAAVERSLFLCGGATLLLAAVLGGGGIAWLASVVFEAPVMAFAAWPTAAWMLLLVFQSLAAESLRGLQDIRAAVIFGGALTAALTAASLGVVWLRDGGADLATAVGWSAASCGVSALAGLGLLLWRLRRHRTGASLERGALSSVAAPLWFGGMTHFALTQASIWIVGFRLPEEQVALFGSAQRLIALIGMPLMVINAVIPPLVVELYSRGERQRLERIMRFVATLSAAPALLFFAIFALAGGPVLGVVFGEFYRDAWLCLALLAAGQTFSVAVGSCGITLAMLGEQRAQAAITIVTSVMSVLGTLLAIGPFGIGGVAAVAASMSILQNFLFARRLRRRLGLRVWAGLGTWRGWREFLNEG